MRLVVANFQPSELDGFAAASSTPNLVPKNRSILPASQRPDLSFLLRIGWHALSRRHSGFVIFTRHVTHTATKHATKTLLGRGGL
jgi:hypothetical protein